MAVINGDSGDNVLVGTEDADTLNGEDGADSLYGLGGADTLNGGPGNDAYIVEGEPGNQRVFDIVNELVGEGYDRVYIGGNSSFYLGAQTEVEYLEGGWVIEGNELGQTILGHNRSNGTYRGGGGDDIIDGLDGHDDLVGGAGADQFVFSQVLGFSPFPDRILDFAVGEDEIVLVGGDGAFFATLGDGPLPANAFTIGAEATTAEHRIIYDGTNLYYDRDGAGFEDAVRFAQLTTAPALTASDIRVSAQNPPVPAARPTEGDDVLIGGTLDDTLSGLGGNDVLDGRAGADTMDGGPGNDRYYVDDAFDAVIEQVGEGVDTVYTLAFRYTLPSSEVENLRTTDDAGTNSIELIGNQLDNTIYGNAGNNLLEGRAGNDMLFGWGGTNTLRGGLGDDTFWVGIGVDLVEEAAGQGYDRVYSRSDFALLPSAEVEFLATDDHAGIASITLIGNEFGQAIYGNRGNNALEGLGGADTLVGGLGDDRYYVSDSLDTIVEYDGEGSDSVIVNVNYRLPEGTLVEALIIGASGAGSPIVLTGNTAANSIYGAAGADILEGGGGRDYLIGGAGNDQYYADMNDLIIEGANGGSDMVVALANYTLADGARVEALVAGGTGHLHLSGSSFRDSLYGNGGNNILDGWAGADYLTGGGGTDRFRFTFSTGGGEIDTLMDFTSSIDRIELSAAVFGALPTGQLAASAFAQGSQTADADDRIAYHFESGALFYDADGTGSGAAVQFAWLQPGTSLQAGDIWVI